jgi:hypothetical protein
MRSTTILLAFAAVVSALPMQAAIIYNNTPGAIVVASHMATFDGIGTGSVINDYTEDNIHIQYNGGTAYNGYTPAPGGFNGGFYYASSGVSDYFRITAANNALLYGLQFNVGSGYLAQQAGDVFLTYAIVKNAAVIASGFLTVNTADNGAILGFRDAGGFDSLYIANYEGANRPFSTIDNALAMDDLQIDLNGAAVPEPSTAMLLGTAMVGLAAFVRKHARS